MQLLQNAVPQFLDHPDAIILSDDFFYRKIVKCDSKVWRRMTGWITTCTKYDET